MINNYNLNPELDVPIYRQLFDAISTDIKNGKLEFGYKLPTVLEMTEKLGIARGTAKRTYDELERAGLIEKVQGRGTFVCYKPVNSESRKELAMSAIDELLLKLEDMGFSSAEINIFLNLKLREFSEHEAPIKVAVVECNPENLSQITEQLRNIDGVDIFSYLFDEIEKYPYKISEDFELVITTSQHGDYLESVLPVKKKLARVALRASSRCLSDIIRLKPGAKVGIIGYSERFCRLLIDTCKLYADDLNLAEPILGASDDNVKGYLKNKDVVLVPKFYEKYFDADTVSILARFSGELIYCYYELDEGSLLYLENKIKKLRDKRSI